MIGVLVKKEDYDIVREFFELFKTPWEFYDPERKYEVILVATPDAILVEASLVILFGSFEIPGKDKDVYQRKSGVSLLLESGCLPLYKECLIFDQMPTELPVIGHSGTAAIRKRFDWGTEIRLGYDFFDECRFLLCNGQPKVNAEVPSLEKHIELLRTMILSAGIELIEIPPIPAGYPFIICLTHDVDHPLLRNHLVDHTAVGFLYRATIGSIVNVFRGRIGFLEMLKNVWAVFKFPLVHLKLARDYWDTFDRYMDIESGLASTFFVIPRCGDPGTSKTGHQPKKRAASYTLEEIRPQLDEVLTRGGEVSLHGIDAWNDVTKARKEKQRVSQFGPSKKNGVRMHWLCFDQESPKVLDQAGFSYDSTVGYNGTVGYRAGTLQVFRPIGVKNLLELPLHIMDTALFYPAHRNLSCAAAKEVVQKLFADALSFGGLLTINWHDRSIAPERQWGGFYAEMLEELKEFKPWFATASQAADWFRMRRGVVIEEIRRDGKVVKVKVKVKVCQAYREGLPELKVRLMRPGVSTVPEGNQNSRSVKVVEKKFKGDMEINFVI